MILQEVRLDGWDWNVFVFYDTDRHDSRYILRLMRRLLCGRTVFRSASDNLRSGIWNTGLTYTSPRFHATLMVVSRTTDGAQFWNTLDHEKGHVVSHISEYYGLPPEGEEIEYLRGELAGKLYPVAVRFLCEGCGRESAGSGFP